MLCHLGFPVNLERRELISELIVEADAAIITKDEEVEARWFSCFARLLLAGKKR